MRTLAVAAALALALGPGCHQGSFTASQSAPELIVFNGASNVKAEGEEVRYELDAAYPAREQIAAIDEHLKSGVYRPLVRSDYVGGWRDFVQGAEHVYEWKGEWRNEVADLVTYTLQYRYPASEGPELSHLFVAATRQRGGAKGQQTPTLDVYSKANTNHR